MLTVLPSSKDAAGTLWCLEPGKFGQLYVEVGPEAQI